MIFNKKYYIIYLENKKKRGVDVVRDDYWLEIFPEVEEVELEIVEAKKTNPKPQPKLYTSDMPEEIKEMIREIYREIEMNNKF